MVPTIEQMITAGRRCAAKVKRHSKKSLQAWFEQSERLTIARDQYGLRGERFIEFAAAIGVDRSSAYNLVKLIEHRAAIEQECKLRGVYPGWQTCLQWFVTRPRLVRNSPSQERIAELEAALADLQQQYTDLQRRHHALQRRMARDCEAAA